MAERAKITQLSGTFSESLPVGIIALGTSDEVVVWFNNTGASVLIKSAGYVPDTAVTGDNTNNLILQFRNKQTGAGTVAVTSTKAYTTGTDLTAFALDALTVSTTAATATIDSGECLALNKTETGSGLALPEGHAVITYEFV